jgi:hypothetical protein
MSAHWNGINADKAKAYWGRKLMHMRRESIGYALRHLPNNPPTVEEFCAIASRCPPPTFKALPWRLSEEDRQKGKERIAKIREMFK